MNQWKNLKRKDFGDERYMWLEIKALITGTGCFIFTIVILLSGNLIFALLCVMGMFTIIFGDIIYGYRVVNTDAVHLIDATGLGEKIIDLHLIGGGRRFIKAKKGALGKWEFVYHKKKCSVIDDGSYPTRLPNHNPCIIAHESSDKALNIRKGELLRKLFKKYSVTNTKDLYFALKKHEAELLKKEKGNNIIQYDAVDEEEE